MEEKPQIEIGLSFDGKIYYRLLGRSADTRTIAHFSDSIVILKQEAYYGMTPLYDKSEENRINISTRNTIDMLLKHAANFPNKGAKIEVLLY